jgi:hypothetical protein|tara:strand:- start:2400 stop:2558 length:159 start_codon:yes stop_codon:yes gene_type:complete
MTCGNAFTFPEGPEITDKTWNALCRIKNKVRFRLPLVQQEVHEPENPCQRKI